jgi:hypothetical protein
VLQQTLLEGTDGVLQGERRIMTSVVLQVRAYEKAKAMLCNKNYTLRNFTF